MKRTAILVLGTAEWDATIATNQHYASQALAQEFDVLFVESLGLRRPTLGKQDLSRIRQRLVRRSASVSQESRRPRPDRLDVASPLVVPVHRTWTRAVNGRLLRRSIRSWLDHDGPRLLWTYTPVTYGLESHATATIYHLVDLLHTYPRIDAEAVLRNEKLLRKTACAAIASSPAVADHLTSAGFDRVELLPNVAEVGPFLDAASKHSPDSGTPVAVFAGNITPTKIDLRLIERLSALAGDSLRIRMIGPVGLGGGVPDGWQRRLAASGAELVAPMALDDLAVDCARASVGLIPYAINDYTRGVNPLKTYEYLAAGLPVVSTPVPAVAPVADAIWVEQAAEGFAKRALDVSRSSDPGARSRRQDLARQNSWAERGAELRRLARQALGHQS